MEEKDGDREEMEGGGGQVGGQKREGRERKRGEGMKGRAVGGGIVQSE